MPARLAMISVWMWLSAVAPVTAAPSGASEEAITAAYVYNFVKFAEWPADALDVDDEKMTICTDAGGALREAIATLEDRPVKGRTIMVIGLPENGLAGCHVALVSDPRNTGSLLGHKPVLTVSMFASHDAVIHLFRSGKKLRFAVHQAAMRRASLRLSARLLSVAADVTD